MLSNAFKWPLNASWNVALHGIEWAQSKCAVANKHKHGTNTYDKKLCWWIPEWERAVKSFHNQQKLNGVGAHREHLEQWEKWPFDLWRCIVKWMVEYSRINLVWNKSTKILTNWMANERHITYKWQREMRRGLKKIEETVLDKTQKTRENEKRWVAQSSRKSTFENCRPVLTNWRIHGGKY